MPYRYLEELETATSPYEATGCDLVRMFRDGCDAMTNVMIDNIGRSSRANTQIELSNDKLDMLLFDLLQS